VILHSIEGHLLTQTRGVAWSRLGSIASFTPNGRTIEFRNLRCHPVDGSWDLSEATSSHRHPDAIPYQHLIWSPNGIDLAAIDAAGRISIFNSNLFLNAANMIRDGAVDPADDLNAVVGAYWLNLMPPQMRPVCVTCTRGVHC
jgi:mediator of RNA polymerase II transcription subunit 16